MNNIPMIDPRKAGELLKEIKRKARIYTPEWKAAAEAMDGGVALAELFSQMFGETLDRLNRVPYKHYIEFLNLLGVSAQSVTPATGLAAFTVSSGYEKNVPIKKGTQMYCNLDGEQEGDESRKIIFETTRDFFATPAGITAMFSVDPRRDLIEKLNLDEAPARFFDPSPEKNIQSHFFAVSCEDVLNLCSPAELIVELENSVLGYLNEEFTARLADGSFAAWTYTDGSRQIPFDRVFMKDNLLHLIKDNPIRMAPEKVTGEEDEEERVWLRCEMKSQNRSEEIVMNRIRLGSSYLHKDKQGVHIAPDNLYFNDTVMEVEEGGYCFGKQPTAYDCFYIASEEVFSKRDSLINMELALNTVVRPVGSSSDMPQYQFNRRYIVEKADISSVEPEKIFISRIVWEYWNGNGWAHLKVEGDQNPFNGQEAVNKKHISFRCPADMGRSMQNSIDSYWIRARVIEVENAYAMVANLFLPYVESVSMDYDYMGALKPVERVVTGNNCESKSYEMPDTSTFIKLFQPMPENAHAVYLAFDLPPAGYPINLYIQTEGRSNVNRQLSIEYRTRDVKGESIWRELKVNDGTEELEEDGILSVYAPQDFEHASIFGQEGYWLRIVDKNMRFSEVMSFPIIQKILPNVAEIIQKQTISKEMFGSDLFESEKELALLNKPVLDTAVWVNEIHSIAKSEMTELAAKNPQDTDTQYDDSGQASEFWVRWERRESLLESGPGDRHYTVDAYNGKIRFGNGRNGKVPSPGEDTNIRVDYSFGGGKQGNLPEGSIEDLIVGIPYIEKVTNPEMTCGGSDQHDIGTLERVGPQKLKHRGRAVTVSDFENIILEHFCDVRDVKCVSNYNRVGRQASGYVTVVVMPCDIENRSYSLKLCRKIEQFLSGIMSCELLAGGRFSVVPAVVLKVSVSVTISVDDYEFAAETEKQAIGAIASYLNPVGPGNGRLKIEEIPSVPEFYSVLKGIAHIASVDEVALEGSYYDGNVLKVVPLDGGFRLKYAVVCSGEHIVRII